MALTARLRVEALRRVRHAVAEALAQETVQAGLPAGRRATGEGIMVVRNKKTSTATTTLYINDLKRKKVTSQYPQVYFV